MSSDLSSLICVQDFEREATSVLSKATKGFYNSGATEQQTLRENCSAIKRWYIRPRFLVDVSKCDLTSSILGHVVDVPFGIAPMGMQKLAHLDGEYGSCKAAAEIGAVSTLSTVSTSSIEEVATLDGLKLFQLYIYKKREITERLIRRVEKTGFKAIVLTVDSPALGIRLEDIRNKFTLPQHLKLANFEGGAELGAYTSKGGSGLEEYVKTLYDSTLTWEDVAWLKSLTTLPIVLKGVLTAEDALRGVKEGASAIWVSNHGGRQLDGVYPSIDALPEVVAAVGDKCEVYVDGGFRTGSDIFKALALGAKMVFIGRPVIWGLACGGTDGVRKVMNLLKNELQNTMELSGYTSVKDIRPEVITRAAYSRL